MRYILITLVLLASAAAQAQKKPVYTASLDGDLLNGNNGVSTGYFFSNGIDYKSITVGVGAGIDNYLFRSVPLFFDVRKEFGKHTVQPFLGYSAGININAIKAEQRQYFDTYENEDIRAGFYTRAMLGISVKLQKSFRFYTGVGYSYKTTKVNYQTHNYYPTETLDPGSTIYRMNRWNVIFGFRF